MADSQAILDRAVAGRNIVRLKKICIDEGLKTNENRQKVWPLLLKIYDSTNFMSNWSTGEIKCKDSDIIGLDVNRSLFGLDLTDAYTEEERIAKRVDLSNIINAVFKFKPEFHYSQGFHSLCTTFLLVGDQDLGFKMSYQCAQLFVRDSLRKSFDEALVPSLMLFYTLLRKLDKELADKIEGYYRFEDELSVPMFCLSWVIAWLGHDIKEYSKVCRVYDFFLSTHSLAPLYFAVNIVLSQKEIVMETNEIHELHHRCEEIVDSLDIDKICTQSYNLMKKYPPRELIKEGTKPIPKDSPAVLYNNEIEEVFRHDKADEVKTIGLGLVLAAFSTLAIIYSD
ncbi:GYP8 [Blepharisma stoltei]|uniref:Rab-GAP TBC domain-containing protein n=1 Tax=Blepharisma stoltei TaxID=1481888 RepID=A0AAU9ID15_9CILI|nr:unnamed protein product [Blepharisma stoltei]